MKRFLTGIFNLAALTSLAQFPGVVGTSGTSAMYTDSSAFVAWGSQCKIIRGYQDISNSSLGYASVGDSSYAIGKSDAAVVSLGDAGMATVTFSAPVTNGPGYDFAVFENAFNDSFLELAFVEVSSDGVNFVRFTSTCNLPVSPQYDNSAIMDACKINNLAGKYRALYGTPFDLQELNGNPLLDITSITHIRIIDVVGSIDQTYVRFDSQNHVINDPWPTPFPSSGFDLDAVGVIHQKAVGIKELSVNSFISMYPNPAKDKLIVRGSELAGRSVIYIRNITGEVIIQKEPDSDNSTIDIKSLNAGIYFVTITSSGYKQTGKLIIE